MKPLTFRERLFTRVTWSANRQGFLDRDVEVFIEKRRFYYLWGFPIGFRTVAKVEMPFNEYIRKSTLGYTDWHHGLTCEEGP